MLSPLVRAVSLRKVIVFSRSMLAECLILLVSVVVIGGIRRYEPHHLLHPMVVYRVHPTLFVLDVVPRRQFAHVVPCTYVDLLVTAIYGSFGELILRTASRLLLLGRYG